MESSTAPLARAASEELIDFLEVKGRSLERPYLGDPLKKKNRSRLTIVSQLLELAKEESVKTHLMFGANLSFRTLERYLDLLMTNGLILETPRSGSSLKKYMLSARGAEFLQTYYQLETLFRREMH